MKKMKKTFAIILCAALAAGILTGCGDADRDKYIAKTRSEAESGEQTPNEEEETPDEETPDEERVTSDGAWKSMAFNIAGTDLTLSKIPLSSLESEGWGFDHTLYGMNGVTVESGTYYQRSIYLNHADYDDGTILVGLGNFKAESCSMDEVQLWSIEFLTKDKTDYPSIKLEGGITWGSDESAIKKAYGEPSAAERNDTDGYTELIYTDNAGKTICLDVYDETGVGRIVMDCYA